jgi:hypothetical protein
MTPRDSAHNVWLIAILALAIGATAGCCCGPHGDSSNERDVLEPILGSLDAPVRGSTVRGLATFGGWAVAESQVKWVAIYIDRQLVSLTSVGGTREDVAKRYYKLPAAAKSGFSVAIDTTPMAAGEHQIVAQVKSNLGAVREFGPVPFQVAH